MYLYCKVFNIFSTLLNKFFDLKEFIPIQRKFLTLNSEKNFLFSEMNFNFTETVSLYK